MLKRSLQFTHDCMLFEAKFIITWHLCSMAPEHFTGILTHLYTLKDLAPCKLRYVRIGSCTIQLRTSASLQVIKLVSRCKTILQGTVKGGRRQGRQEEEVGRQHQGMDRPGAGKVSEGSGEQRQMEETGCEAICGAPTTPAVKRRVKGKRRSTIGPIARNGLNIHPQQSGLVHVKLMFQFSSVP